MNKIAHLTSVHTPFDTRIFFKECRTLYKSGYDVVLIAQYDSDNIHEGIQIRAIPRSKNRFKRMTVILYKLYKKALAENADLYHFHDPELMLVGILLHLHGKKVIYDVHEDLPRHILDLHWIPVTLRPFMAKGAKIVERCSVLFYDGVIAVTSKIASGFPQSKTEIVRNFANLNELKQESIIPYSKRQPLIAFIGSIGVVRGITEMVTAVEILPDRLQAHLLLAGSSFSPPELEQEIKRMPGFKKVTHLGWQSRESVAGILGKSRAGLVVSHPSVNIMDGLPVKLFEYMAAGIPVIASDFPVWREIVEEARCGILVNPLDANSIAKAIQWLLENPEEAEAMGQRGLAAVREKYNWDYESKKLLSFYKRFLQ